MDIAGFYEQNEQRRQSEEVTYGDAWTTESDEHATYRAIWVRDTGEFYTIREPHQGGLLAKYLDTLHIDQADTSELTVDVLAVIADRDELLRRISGWEQAVAGEDSLAWLKGRLAG